MSVYFAKLLFPPWWRLVCVNGGSAWECLVLKPCLTMVLRKRCRTFSNIFTIHHSILLALNISFGLFILFAYGLLNSFHIFGVVPLPKLFCEKILALCPQVCSYANYFDYTFSRITLLTYYISVSINVYPSQVCFTGLPFSLVLLLLYLLFSKPWRAIFAYTVHHFLCIKWKTLVLFLLLFSKPWLSYSLIKFSEFPECQQRKK